MAIFKSLRTLTRKPNFKNFLSFSPQSPSSHILSPCHSPFLSRSKFLYPLSNGPLFLSFPPWKLSQSATPVYFQSDVVFIPKIEPLYLIHTRKFPINLGFQSVVSSPRLLEDKELGRTEVDTTRARFSESFVNFPNLVSMSRLISGPCLGWMIIHEMYLPAFVGLVISGATDWLDGYMARKMGINSVIGSYLDPLADKVLIGCVALAMVERGLLHAGLVGLVVTRDVALIGGAMYKRASNLEWEWKSWFDFFNFDGTRPQKVEPLFLSKVNTVFQLVLVAAALLQPEFGTEETEAYITYLSWLVASTTVASTAAYGAQHLRNGSSLMKKNV